MDDNTHTVSGGRIELRRATIDEILDLRMGVIIRGTDRDTPDFDGDRDASTRHFGSFMGQTCVACLSLMQRDDEGVFSYQLRGMAVADALQGTGLGAALLRYTERAMAEEFGALGRLWCNARTGAAGFYRKMGWKQIGEAFDIPRVGPHVRMTRALGEG